MDYKENAYTRLFTACVEKTDQKWMALKLIKDNNSLARCLNDDTLDKLMFEGMEEQPGPEMEQKMLLNILSKYSEDYKNANSAYWDPKDNSPFAKLFKRHVEEALRDNQQEFEIVLRLLEMNPGLTRLKFNDDKDIYDLFEDTDQALLLAKFSNDLITNFVVENEHDINKVARFFISYEPNAKKSRMADFRITVLNTVETG